MKTVLDGIIYEIQSRGGVSRLYSEILPRMCAMEDSLEITLLTGGNPQQPMPVHRNITYRGLSPLGRVFRPYRFWSIVYPRLRSLAHWLAVRDGQGMLWHSTYYTVPMRWAGPTLVTVHDMCHERFPELFSTPAFERFRQLKKRCVSAADGVICVSMATQRDVQEFLNVDSDRIQVVPHASSDTFRVLHEGVELASFPDRDPFLLYVGMRSRHKNFRLLVEAYSRWDRRTEFNLAVVGSPWMGEERRRLEALGVGDQVHLLTDIDDEELCQLYNQASTFVYPSLYEGFGIPLLEAMACGCPIVASRIPSTLEVAKECPIYFEPTESDDLIAALDVAIAEGRDSDRVRAGLEAVRYFSWDETARRTLEVYRALSNSD